jgi:excinuclease UvrABC nuclease subunit
MPFPKQDGRLFIESEIEKLLPGQRGVYGIYRPDRWIYVGRSNDLRQRLLEHLADPHIMAQKPTAFLTWVTTDDVRVEKALIVELDPALNQKIG